MSSAKPKSDRLAPIWRAWGMKQQDAEAKAQRSALAAVETYLKSGPAAILRGMQALLIDPEQPGASKRVLFEPLWDATQDAWAAVGTGDDDVMLMQAVLLAAAWPKLEIVPALLSPWMVMRGRERQRKELEAWRDERAVEKYVIQDAAWALPEKLRKPSSEALGQVKKLNAEKHAVEIHIDYNRRPKVLGVTAYDDLRSVIESALVEIYEDIGALHLEREKSIGNLYKLVTAQAKKTTHQEYLWWGQARYCHTLRKPFRRIGDPYRTIYLAAREAAERAASLPVEPSAAYLQEVLHALDLPILEVRPLAEHVKQLRNVLATDPPPKAPAELALLLRHDAFGLPVSLLCAAPNTPDDALLEQLGVAADTPIDLGDWAAWIFRELVLLHRWPEQA